MRIFSDPSAKQLTALRAVLHLLALLPFLWLLIGTLLELFGDKAFRVILRETGDWSLYFLCITLAVTPLRLLTGWNWLVSFRRLPGMYAFAYGVLHFFAYLWLARSQDVIQVLERILTRPVLLTGFIALLIMLALALTSTAGMFKALGMNAWQWLHRLTYVSAVLAVLHYWLLKFGRHDVTQPVLFGVIVALLLLFRIGAYLAQRRAVRNAG